VAFVAPGGRWNPGLGRAVASLGYGYGSEFQLGYDDVPFVPHGADGVLQVPVHPVCEGLFLDAGVSDPTVIAAYYVRAVRARIAAGEPAFVYGHPERRLGRMPEVVEAIAREVADRPSVWKTTLTAFARWWHWRLAREWSVVRCGPSRYEVRFEDGDLAFGPQLEIVREDQVATFAVGGPRRTLSLDQARFEQRPGRANEPPRAVRRAWSVRGAVRSAMDWEKVTPVDELPARTLPMRLKRSLRRMQEAGEGRS
jgi:hypothetical protein